MLKNYLKIAWRSIWKHKLFSTINSIGLAIGLSASFVIGAMIYYDLTFDKFHPDSEHIYRITTEFTTPEGKFYNPGVTVPLAEKLKNDTPGLKEVAPVFTSYPLHVKNATTEKLFKNPEFVVYADKEYFNNFEYEWLAGSKEVIFNNPNEVVLSENRARKYFPEKQLNEIIGSALIYNDTIPVSVTGIVANFKQRTDIVFEEFISMKTADNKDMSNLVENAGWGNTSSASQLFVKLSEKTNLVTIRSELGKIAKEFADPETISYDQTRKFHLQPLSELHFDPNYYTFDFDSGRASKPVLISLGFIALFLLLLGCINFINLNTAQATQRAKEIGIRKTLGSSKKQLIFQFLGETFFLTLFAAVLSFFLSFWLLKIFSDFIPEGISFQLFKEPMVIISILLLLIIVTFLSGFYPAMVLSQFRPASVLKSQFLRKGDKSSLRKYLTVFQFVIAQIFIIGTLLVGKQLNYLMSKDMGIKTDAIVHIRTPWQTPSLDKRIRLEEEIRNLPQVAKTSLSSNPPASFSTNSSHVTFFDDEKEVKTELQFLYGDKNYLDLYDIDILSGRKQLNDTIQEIVINESYMKLLGFKTPENAIGKTIKMSDKIIPIVGVMEDFNQRSLKSRIEPMAFAGDWYREKFSRFNTLHLALSKENSEKWSETIGEIESVYKSIYPDADFTVTFMDDMIKRFYEQERKTAVLLNWATGLSILISCLGLLGLVIHTTERRTKEIGIRKVLGASVLQLNVLLSSEFLKLVGIAF
ncbi:FtsX-like permease family protein [Aureibaculum sp. 2210JD6-5]|uniref:ABC transporter permease n=1 Tax=Aureibaculum sp. 2210JD6-5 TaxID=3103957 RepID=UPI002AADD9A0|nr:ABC transporter permease [Aureibaculum sp. 2210JD6-5]MDY7393881.1 FtsX-like permease family protein [Aureibaculum sp. 2210JD6-5]